MVLSAELTEKLQGERAACGEPPGRSVAAASGTRQRDLPWPPGGAGACWGGLGAAMALSKATAHHRSKWRVGQPAAWCLSPSTPSSTYPAGAEGSPGGAKDCLELLSSSPSPGLAGPPGSSGRDEKPTGHWSAGGGAARHPQLPASCPCGLGSCLACGAAVGFGFASAFPAGGGAGPSPPCTCWGERGCGGEGGAGVWRVSDELLAFLPSCMRCHQPCCDYDLIYNTLWGLCN